jgi:hypothetical protein
MEPQIGEEYLPEYKVYVCGYKTSDYGIELMSYEEDCPLPKVVKTKPHIALLKLVIFMREKWEKRLLFI